jgi:serine/threonine protein kinase
VVLKHRGHQSVEFPPGFTHISEIGTEDVATVYAATDADSGRSVALKLLNVREISPDALQAFLRETSVLEALSAHPNIVTLHRTDVTPDGRPVLVMELCRGSMAEGATGQGGTGQGAMDPAVAVSVAIKIAGALETAHRAGMVHGSVTPHKVLMTQHGEPALADLGTAHLRSFADTAGAVDFATLHMAPEMLEGTTATTASDIYELACTLYTQLAGQVPFQPFDGEASAAVIVRILRDPLPPLTGAGIPLALSDLLVQSMAKNPLKRPSSALEFADRLKRIEVAQSWPPTDYFVVDGAAYRFLEPLPSSEDDASGRPDRAPEPGSLGPAEVPVVASVAGEAREGAEASSMWHALKDQPTDRPRPSPRFGVGWPSPKSDPVPMPVARHAPAPLVAPRTTSERRVVTPVPRRTVASRRVATGAPTTTNTHPNTGRRIDRPDPLLGLLSMAEEARRDPGAPELQPRFRDPGPRTPASQTARHPEDGGVTDDGAGVELSAQEVEEAIRRADRLGGARRPGHGATPGPTDT